MNITITSDLVSEPLSLTEAKDWMRIKEFTTDDTLITGLIKSTRMHLEKFTGVSFGTKTIEAILDIKDYIEVPYGPVSSITSVYKWISGEWYLMTVDDDYWMIGSTLEVYSAGKYKVTYQAGYSTLPEDLKTDIKVLVAWQYENRGINFSASTQTTIKEYPHWNLLNSRQYRKVVI